VSEPDSFSEMMELSVSSASSK